MINQCIHRNYIDWNEILVTNQDYYLQDLQESDVHHCQLVNPVSFEQLTPAHFQPVILLTRFLQMNIL